MRIYVLWIVYDCPIHQYKTLAKTRQGELDKVSDYEERVGETHSFSPILSIRTTKIYHKTYIVARQYQCSL